MKNKIEHLLSLIGLMIFVFFAFGTSENKESNDYQPKQNFVDISSDCEQVKNSCLYKVKTNLPEMVETLFAIEGDSRVKLESSADSILFALKCTSKFNDITNLEKYLESNCPETYKEYQDEVGSLIFLYLLQHADEFMREN